MKTTFAIGWPFIIEVLKLNNFQHLVDSILIGCALVIRLHLYNIIIAVAADHNVALPINLNPV